MEKAMFQELEEMRSQLSVLNEKINKEKVVNDRLLRKAMKNKASWISKMVTIEAFIIFPFVMIDLIFLHYQNIVSWWLVGFAALMLGGSVVADYIINNKKLNIMFDGNLVTAAKQLGEMKRLRIKQLYIGLPLAVIFIVWFAWEQIKQSPDDYRPMVGGLIAGGIVGAAIGLFIFRKMQQTNDELIQQIEELTQEPA
ncbi:MAG: hypothetical protein PUH24_01510 [Prevotellaceae bacterium]|nr:hypothetical protein [Prevotella sp.]MDD7256955.1 hypothetical protein [Prevotellaceae bacterium]MDY6131394.1 hypothetical protein [Prevotella sp.]